MERRPQVPVFVHEAERFLIIGVEVQPTRLQSVGNRDAPDRTAGLREMLGDSDGLEHAHRARRHRAGAAIERCLTARRRIGGIDKDGGNAARVEC
jgi:hypothetical protein